MTHVRLAADEISSGEKRRSFDIVRLTYPLSLLELCYQMVNKMKKLPPIDWKFSSEPVLYESAITFMEERVGLIAKGEASECVWLLEHPPLYTAGTSANDEDLLSPDRFPVYKTGRGGEYTYHGPGQRVVYVMLDLNQRRRDVRWFVRELEAWVIDVCAQFNIQAERREGRFGLWVPRPSLGPGREDKIAAIGIRLKKWVSFHGISINLNPDLSHYSGIVPCGISDQGVTSFEDLGQLVSMPELDAALKLSFERHFGSTIRV